MVLIQFFFIRWFFFRWFLLLHKLTLIKTFYRKYVHGKSCAKTTIVAECGMEEERGREEAIEIVAQFSFTPLATLAHPTEYPMEHSTEHSTIFNGIHTTKFHANILFALMFTLKE